jgi:hypothetical protein
MHLPNVKDLWTTLPGIAAIAMGIFGYITTYSGSHAWPPTGMEIFLFFSGLINVFSTFKKPASA